MKVLEFIRNNPDWETILASAPYYIKATWDGDYVLLKYSQLESDFNNEIVRECRGCIFYIPSKDVEWADIVCYPFEKFGNYGESYVPEIDWSTASVLEKVDGSLIKVWHHMGEWHVSTNGNIDARNAGTQVEGVSFYDVFMRALEKNGNPQLFFDALDPWYTYMFELVSPSTRVTIAYPDDAIYYLSARNIATFEETPVPWLCAGSDLSYFINLPKQYALHSLESCIDAANAMSKDEEGFVVCDSHFNRVKVKSPEYLIASNLRNNNAVTVRNILVMLREEKLDDFLAYAPDYQGFVDDVLLSYKRIAQACEMWYLDIFSAMHHEPNKNKPLYEIVSTVPHAFQDYCYKRFNNKISNPYDYLNTLTLGRLVDWVKEYTG